MSPGAAVTAMASMSESSQPASVKASVYRRGGESLIVVSNVSATEAVTAEVDAAKDLQDMYQQMLADAKTDREDRKQQIDELRQERDHYKSDRNELRTKLEETDGKIHKLELDLVRLTKIVEGLRPFLCADLNCQSRKSCIIEEMNAS